MKETTRQIIGQAVLESLEDRRLMSAVDVVGDTVVLQGNSRTNNKLSVALDEGGQTLFVRANKVSAHILTSSLKHIRAIGGEEADLVNIDARLAKSAYIRTGAGNDTINGASGNDTVLAGHGNDYINGHGGHDFIVDGPGADTVLAGSSSDGTAGAPTPYTMSVKSFTLVDSVTNETIGTLTNGSVINLATIGTRRFNVKANLSASSSGSVQFAYDGAAIPIVENAAPYTLAHDDHGDYGNWLPREGTHTISATPYAGKNATGAAGTGLTISFSVIDDASAGTTNLGDGGTGTNGTGGTPTNITPTPAPNLNAPIPAITVLESTVNAGQTVHVNGLTSQLKVGDILAAKFEWSFGDDTAKYNTLTGFNAAHVYDRSGVFTVTLKVTDSAGNSAFATTKVTVQAAGRRFVYVSNNGDDTNTGTSTTQAVKTFARAAQLVGDNTEVLFERGDTFNLTKGMSVGFKNVVVGAYGTGAKPVLYYNGDLHMGMSIIGATAATDGLVVRGLKFDSKFTTGYDGMPVGVTAGGKNITIRENDFGNLADAINCNRLPTGLLAVDNTAGTGIRGYFAWVQGSDAVFLGNKVGDSQFQHVLRSTGVTRMLIAYNDFTQLTPAGGIVKGTLNIHKGDYLYIANNTLHDGMFALGPLGGGDGVSDMAGRTRWVVVENNTVHSPMHIDHGDEHIMVRNNVFDVDNTSALVVSGFDTTYNRGVSDLYLVHNTVINTGTCGNFVKVGAHVDGITMTNNLYVAPHLTPGEYGAAAVYVCDGNLSSFRKIADNIWPMATGLAYAQGGINFIGPSMVATGYQDPKEWASLPQVAHDQFKNVVLDPSTYFVSLGGITAGAEMKAAA